MGWFDGRGTEFVGVGCRADGSEGDCATGGWIEMGQPDLFEEPPTAAALREEERFGEWDALCGLSLDNGYSAQITGARRASYVGAFRKQRAAMTQDEIKDP
jgi:hypothetical protein